MIFDQALVMPLIKIVFLVLVGMAARAAHLIDDGGSRSLTQVVLNITLPAMLFMAALTSDVGMLLREGAWVAVAGLVLPLVGFGVSAGIARLFRLPPRQASVVRVSGAVCNTAFVGIPVCTVLWGSPGALLAAIYDQTMTLPLLTLPPIEYGGKGGRRALRAFFLAPMLWGLVGGIVWRLAGLPLPGWLGESLTLLGGATLPLSLVLVGALMTMARPTGLGRAITAFVLARLVAVPLTVLLIVVLLGREAPAAGVVVLQNAMPASVVATVFAKEYGADATLAAAGALFSYLLALITLPIFASLVARL